MRKTLTAHSLAGSGRGGKWLAAIALAILSSGGAAQGLVAGFATPTIDGVLGPGEWSSAATIAFVANTPYGGTTPATLYVMNDRDNLYVAVRYARAVLDPGNSLAIEFDKDASGTISVGDDAIVFNGGSSRPFFDDFRTSAPPCPPLTLCARRRHVRRRHNRRGRRFPP